MSINYFIFNSKPNRDVLDGILSLNKYIFGTSNDLNNKAENKPQLLVVTAMEDNKVIGYKIGYELENKKFYSLLGGVDIDLFVSNLINRRINTIRQIGEFYGKTC
ncbi:hypothetical protein [Oceanobacillus chungangensis]|uniref:GNAT family N-acetyltransferase n=1 Tax=Oceanobacillus chungangensis TaxID=1229152 RepID=A0A3D8PMD6_9BACI|nr:hypothetical protein [Oceanobacillus chungangensis]RDW17286.1 hypothetical protein CWR45_12905 [Oceanobacillus chungangensis]